MKVFLRIFFIGILITGAASVFGYFFWYNPKFNSARKEHDFSNDNAKATLIKLKGKGNVAKVFANKFGYHDEYCFLIDMSVQSGKKRFFVYNMKKDTVEYAGLVTHGGGNSKTDSIVFSNKPNSLCTSLGKYKVGNSYTGKYGLAYKLYGLEATNDNAFKRYVVLHSHTCVPDGEVAPFSICTSWGCPTVSPSFLQELKPIIDNTNKPVLLWIYK